MFRRSLASLALLSIPAAALGGACSDTDSLPDDQPGPAEGIFAPLGEPLPTATPEQLETFERGREVALRRFTDESGLGPHFNVTFCSSCHEKPVFGGSAGRYRNFVIVRQQLSDGSSSDTGVNGVQPQFILDGAYRPTDEGTNLFVQRNPIPFFGVGLLAEVPEEEILKRSDPDDADGDGISGRPNYDRGFVGRFGRKSQTVSIEGFIRGPLFNHLGITTNPLSDELKNKLPVPSGEGAVQPLSGSLGGGIGSVKQAQAAAPAEPIIDEDDAPDPELSEQDLFDLVSFSMLLAAPEPSEPTEETMHGEAVFHEIGCDSCHASDLVGPRGVLPAYTDLLLHDMGPDLADGLTMGDAEGSEFRTQPLWGIGVVGPYLHDGRADTLEEAILWHGGEGQAARDAFDGLPAGDQTALIAFLKSLGGADQYSEGLVPPDYQRPTLGEYGAPTEGLSASDLERFERGLHAFDRDRAVSEGLGTQYNGDSCRACHFDPVFGGAGPAGVNVTRQAIELEDGTIVAPPGGTMAHRHSVGDTRPPIDPDANVFESRQTPSVLGLGLVDQIPADAILAFADPDDLDGDGISGRPHLLPDGTLGRLGWKANVPNLDEFARDGAFNELGLSLADQPGLIFGASTDDDDVSDPEASREFLDDIAFFMKNLGPPPRTPTGDPAAEDAGEALFASIGCASCHTDALTTDDGTPVLAYSDFLLHDVAPAGYKGIPDGDAGPREFRTAPLWGLATSAPYMHDGRSFSIEHAIMRHETEAEQARLAYEALSPSEREQILAFLSSL